MRHAILARSLVAAIGAAMTSGCTRPSAPVAPRIAHAGDANAQARRTARYVLEGRSRQIRARRERR